MFPGRSTLAFGLGLCVVLWCVTPGMPAESPAGAALLESVNRERTDRHLLPLAPSPALAAVARGHAEELARRGTIDHQSESGLNPLQRVQAAGISGFSLLAENLGQSSVRSAPLDAIVRGWLESPIHRENLLNPAFNTSGIAVLRNRDGGVLAVQLYATF